MLILAPAGRQSKQFLRRVRMLYRKAEPDTDVRERSELRVEYENRSRIFALPGKEGTARGYTPDLIMGDEAARVPDSVYVTFRLGRATSGGRVVGPHGDEADQALPTYEAGTAEGRSFRVSKQDLATTVQVLLQNGRLTITEGLNEARLLIREMKRFRVKFSNAGHARVEHSKETDTDDGLLSLACALRHGEKGSEHRYANVRLTIPT